MFHKKVGRSRVTLLNSHSESCLFPGSPLYANCQQLHPTVYLNLPDIKQIQATAPSFDDPIMIERSDLPKQNLRGSCSQMDQLRWSALKEIITLISTGFINGYQF